MSEFFFLFLYLLHHLPSHSPHSSLSVWSCEIDRQGCVCLLSLAADHSSLKSESLGLQITSSSSSGLFPNLSHDKSLTMGGGLNLNIDWAQHRWAIFYCLVATIGALCYGYDVSFLSLSLFLFFLFFIQ